jgi:hypothetical protein
MVDYGEFQSLLNPRLLYTNALSLFCLPKKGASNESLMSQPCVMAKKGTCANASARKAHANLAGARGHRTYTTYYD